MHEKSDEMSAEDAKLGEPETGNPAHTLEAQSMGAPPEISASAPEISGDDEVENPEDKWKRVWVFNREK